MIDALRSCSDRKDLAVLLGIKPSELSYLLYILPDPLKYSPFCISKKNGGARHILAPTPRLKFVQGKLLKLLYECDDSLTQGNTKIPNLSFGFRRSANIFDNANCHRARSYVLNIDIADFFDQFNFGRVRGFFIKDNRFALSAGVATTIAQIACFDDKLPQGSPCSPHIANLCANFFDQRMVRFLRPLKCRYTRYADDITISTDVRGFPEAVAVRDNSSPQGWSISAALDDLFQRSGFSVNKSKFRMSTYFSRQSVTGLVVNDRPNITREYYLTTRAMCHRLFKGRPIEIHPISNGFSNSCDLSAPTKEVDSIKHLEGRLSYIDYVRERPDLRSLRKKQDNPTQFFCTLLKFNLFRYFIGNISPTILTEGPSDSLYLKAAVKTSGQPVGELINQGGMAVRFFRFRSRAADVLALTGGCGTIKRFLYLYNLHLKEFNRPDVGAPVILLVDNDKAGGDVAKMANGIFKSSISMADPQLWWKIAKHLYLVKTPLAAGQSSSCIEDSLPAQIRNVVLNGKTFSPLPDFDTSKHFGKVALAGYVQANKASITLSGFDPILLAMNAAILDSKS